MWVRFLGLEDPLGKEMAPTIVFLPGKSHRQRSLVGCSTWGCKESDTHGIFQARVLEWDAIAFSV